MEETEGGRETLSGRPVKREKNKRSRKRWRGGKRKKSTSKKRQQKERETEMLEEVSGGLRGKRNKTAREGQKKKGGVKRG